MSEITERDEIARLILQTYMDQSGSFTISRASETALVLADAVMKHIQAKPVKRVADYILSLTDGQVGYGEDPVGFLIASHRYMGHLLKEAGKETKRLDFIIDQSDRVVYEWLNDGVWDDAYASPDEVPDSPEEAIRAFIDKAMSETSGGN